MEKKLYRNTKDKKLMGVCSGFAEYFGLDTTLVRVLWVILCFIAFGIIAYIIAAIIMPEKPAEVAAKAEEAAPAAEEAKAEAKEEPAEKAEDKAE